MKKIDKNLFQSLKSQLYLVTLIAAIVCAFLDTPGAVKVAESLGAGLMAALPILLGGQSLIDHAAVKNGNGQK